MNPQDVPVRLRVTLYPKDQENLHDLVERLDRPETQVVRDALAAYRHHLDVTARLKSSARPGEILKPAGSWPDRSGRNDVVP